jgi:integrase
MGEHTSRLNFTKRSLEALKAPESGRIIYHDAKVAGLCLFVTANARTFYLYRRLRTTGQPAQVRIGPSPELSVENARGKAREWIGDDAKGIDIVASRRQTRQTPTLNGLFDSWMEDYAKVHRKRWTETIREFNKYMAPIYNRRLDQITLGEVARWHGRIGEDHGQVMANRMLGLLRVVFNWGPKFGYTGANPCKGVKRFKETSRKRYVQPGEMKALLDAIDQAGEPWRDYFALLLFTGQRKSDVAAMQWEQIDWDGLAWENPQSKTGNPVPVPLTPPAIAILQDRRSRANGSPFVFPGPGKRGCIRNSWKAWGRLLKTAGLSKLTLHDLRRTAGSWQAALGSSLAIIGASLGHESAQATKIYSRVPLDSIRDSVGKAQQAMFDAAGRQPLAITGPAPDAQPVDAPAI